MYMPFHDHYILSARTAFEMAISLSTVCLSQTHYANKSTKRNWFYEIEILIEIEMDIVPEIQIRAIRSKGECPTFCVLGSAAPIAQASAKLQP